MSKLKSNDYKSLFSYTESFSNSFSSIVNHLSGFEETTIKRLECIEQYLHLLPKFSQKGLLEKSEFDFAIVSNAVVNETLYLKDQDKVNYDYKNDKTDKNNKDKNDSIIKNNECFISKKNFTIVNNQLKLIANLSKSEKDILTIENEEPDDQSKRKNNYININNSSFSNKSHLDSENRDTVRKTNINENQEKEEKYEIEIKDYNKQELNIQKTNSKLNTISILEKDKEIENNKATKLASKNQIQNKGRNLDHQTSQTKYQYLEDQIDELRKNIKTHQSSIHRLTLSRDEEREDIEKYVNNKVNLTLIDVNEIKNIVDSYKNTIEDLKIKVMDFNIYDQIALNKDTGEADSGQLLALVKNLDQKTFKKFESYDTKIREVDSQIKKFHNDIITFPKNIEEIVKSIEVIKSNIQKNENFQIDLNKELEEKIVEVKNHLNELRENNILVENRLKNIENEVFDDNSQPNILNGPDSKSFSQMSLKKRNTNVEGLFEDQRFKTILKKVNDIEKQLNMFFNAGQLDQINEKIEAQKQKILVKADISELKDIREAFSSLVGQIEYLKDEIAVLSDTRKIFDDFNFLSKKVDNMANSLQILKQNDYNPIGKSKASTTNVDITKFVDYSTINDLRDHIKNEFKQYDYTIGNIKRLFEEINSVVLTKASNLDLKAAEDYFMAKLEESKALSIKRFSDRIETNKNFKYIDTLIKNLQDQLNKRMERGDNWLIAKKPVDSYTCASCEAFIGDLKEPDTGFKKGLKKLLPNIPEDKVFRSGAGYSKLLEMIGEGNNNNHSEFRNKKIIRDGLSKSQFKEDSGNNNTINALNSTMKNISKTNNRKENGINNTMINSIVSGGENSEGGIIINNNNNNSNNNGYILGNTNFINEDNNHIVKIVKKAKK